MNLPGGLLQPPFAHRGLWGPGQAAENSLTAIELACQMGYGAEFDVRLSADGEAVVFHDETLARMAGIEAAVSTVAAADLAKVQLQGGPDGIPTLGEVLKLVDGRSMLLVELKAGPDRVALARRTAELLRRYAGPVAVISFDPESLAWFAAERPQTLRGLDAMWQPEDEAEAGAELACQCAIAQPHFLLLEKQAAISKVADIHRREGRPVIAWTMRSTDEVEQVADHCDNFIFEGFTA